MNINEYKTEVIKLFQSGKATDKQWGEMADAVLYVSESDSYKKVFMIDYKIEKALLPKEDVEEYEKSLERSSALLEE